MIQREQSDRRLRWTWTLVLVLLGISPAFAEAQDWCPPPTLTVDSISARVEAVIAGTLSFGEVSPVYEVQTVISLAFGDGGCPRLLPDIDPDEALREVFLWGMRHPVPEVAGPVLRFAGARAFQQEATLPWSPLELHLQASREATTAGLRRGVIHGLFHEADRPDVRAVLLDMIRSPAGPPGNPDLPGWLMLVLRFPPYPAAQRLLEEIQEAPELVRNPRARWELQCRGRHGPFAEEDPCHPRHRPSLIAPGGG